MLWVLSDRRIEFMKALPFCMLRLSDVTPWSHSTGWSWWNCAMPPPQHPLSQKNKDSNSTLYNLASLGQDTLTHTSSPSKSITYEPKDLAPSIMLPVSVGFHSEWIVTSSRKHSWMQKNLIYLAPHMPLSISCSVNGLYPVWIWSTTLVCTQKPLSMYWTLCMYWKGTGSS